MLVDAGFFEESEAVAEVEHNEYSAVGEVVVRPSSHCRYPGEENRDSPWFAPTASV
jgi:hypothetical protein